MDIRLRPKALQDLQDIIDYIATENPPAALRIVDDIERFCLETLPDHPLIGAQHDDILSTLRIFPIAGYRVCYFVREDFVDVVRVLHQARDLPRHLGNKPD